MNQRTWNRILCFSIALLLALQFPAKVSARDPSLGGIYDKATNSWKLPDWQVLEFEEHKKIMEIYPKDVNLFQNSRYMMPGGTGEDYVFIDADRDTIGVNTAGLIYLEALPYTDWATVATQQGKTEAQMQAESEKLLAAMQIEIQSYSVDANLGFSQVPHRGGTPVYEGSLDGVAAPDSNLHDYNFNGKIYLGSILPDENLMLKLTIHAPEWIDNQYADTMGYINWRFYFISSDVYVPPPYSPGTNVVDKPKRFFKWIEDTETPTSTPGIIILGNENPLGKLPHTGGGSSSLSNKQILLLFLGIIVGAFVILDLVGDKKEKKKKTEDLLEE